MRKKEITERYSVDENGKITPRLLSRSNWARVDALTPAEIERLADEEDGPLPDDWNKNLILGIPEPKQDVYIRLDPAIIRWFKSKGPGYQTRRKRTGLAGPTAPSHRHAGEGRHLGKQHELRRTMSAFPKS